MDTYIPIDSHAGQPVTWNINDFGNHVLNIATTATLQEDVQAQTFRFWFHTESTLDGTSQPVTDRYVDVAGDIPSTTTSAAEDANLQITLAVSNWNLAAGTVSCNLSLSIQYLGFGGLGPSTIFDNQLFSGNVVAAQSVSLDAAMTSLTSKD